MKKLCFLALLLSVIVAAGCSKDDTESDNPNKPEEQPNYTIADTGGSVPIAFEADADWEASVEYADSDSEWLTLTPESGKAGKANLTITAEPNTSTAKRKASVRILCGGKQRIQSCVFSVVQSGLNKNTNISAFFDPLFAQELQKRDYVADAKHITLAEVGTITKLNVSGNRDPISHEYTGELTSLRGIEYFRSLKNLHCRGNQLTALDVSKNTALEYLDCDYNQLTALDLSRNTALTFLSCNHNQLTLLDVSKNTVLRNLWCYFNQLTALDVSKNTALTWLYCSINQLTALDVSKNTALKFLNCGDNQLITLDVSKNTALTELYCSINQLTALDVSKNTALTELDCGWNELTALDVSKNTALTELDCRHNRLTSLDISKNTKLTKLFCTWNAGDGSVFPVKAWFDNNSIPNSEDFTTGSWTYDGKTVRIDYRKAK